MENTSTPDSFFSDIYETSHRVEYAGFWIRVAALIIDSFALMIPNFVLQMLFMGSVVLNQEELAENPAMMFAGMGTFILASMMLSVLYKAILESSSWQATLGKKALNLKVTDEHGHRISFMRSLGRSLASYLSTAVMFIGYIMVAFSSRKQGLHDKIASTLVVKTH
ncbi:RDD family protein [Rufibacter glacialis]|uniref:RDD family protein n=1 Tax=Rufibacter glacialis TaxID=1259555 RepID=A0A5M8QLU8_9BACT|nr:RDD family protein [Rufibacter glacialis]KAA6437125.1 RDD family protein [Rufibacter glacialis]GGK61880.1 hypothetical protein GCM10011405_07510 [Rufibacter glacialis]